MAYNLTLSFKICAHYYVPASSIAPKPTRKTSIKQKFIAANAQCLAIRNSEP